MFGLLAATVLYAQSFAEMRLTNSSPHVATITFFNSPVDSGDTEQGPFRIAIDGIDVTFNVSLKPNKLIDNRDTVTVISVSPGYYVEPSELILEEGATGEIRVFEWVMG